MQVFQFNIDIGHKLKDTLKVWTFSESLFKTLPIKYTSDKINITKNALFILSRAATHHNFIFN